MSAFVTQREFACSPQDVFAAISDGSRLARWWGPANFSNEFETFDFQVGGRWVFTMVGPDGARYPNESVFTEIVAQQRVVIDHTCAPFFRLTLTLTPSTKGTVLGWEQVFADPAVAKAVAPIVEPANEQNLDRLGAELGQA